MKLKILLPFQFKFTEKIDKKNMETNFAHKKFCNLLVKNNPGFFNFPRNFPVTYKKKYWIKQ